MVVVERSYSGVRSVIKKVTAAFLIVFGFFVLLALPAGRVSKFFGMTSGSDGVAHADFVNTVAAPVYDPGGGGGGEGCGGGGSGCGEGSGSCGL